MRLGISSTPKEENEKISTLLEGEHFRKLRFRPDEKIDEGKGSNEKK
jgi:hypothetical protein